MTLRRCRQSLTLSMHDSACAKLQVNRFREKRTHPHDAARQRLSYGVRQLAVETLFRVLASDGQITVEFTPVVSNPQINAIEITP
jgi:hypothetical protein